MINGGSVSWTSHKQSAVALLTMEAEYMALSDASRESIARSQFLEEMNIPITPITILSDCQTAFDIAENPSNFRNAKYIDIRYHAVRNYIQQDKIDVDYYIPTERQTADILTKSLGPINHQKCVELLGLRNSYDKDKMVED
ncbi:MAG TPA: Ty1/Copia family ribonuclease HI [Bacteroidota bacterium]|nr:Ty1/Copia family ribonuclease HI [Bacteroidota bacterium]